jgi:hypothetical protein
MTDNDRVTDHEGNTRSAGQAYDQAQQKKQEAQQQKEQHKGEAKDQLKSHAQDLNQSRDPNASLSEQKDQVLGRADQKRSAAESETNQNAPSGEEARGKAYELKNRIPEERRQQVSQAVDETKEFLHDVFPEERRDQFIYRLKKVVVECQEHKDYQEAMEWLLNFFESKSFPWPET